MSQNTGDRLDHFEDRLDDFNLELIRLRTRMEGQEKTIDSIDSKLDSLLLEMSRYRGIWGGILMVASCLFAFIKLVGIAWFTGK